MSSTKISRKTSNSKPLGRRATQLPLVAEDDQPLFGRDRPGVGGLFQQPIEHGPGPPHVGHRHAAAGTKLDRQRLPSSGGDLEVYATRAAEHPPAP